MPAAAISLWLGERPFRGPAGPLGPMPPDAARGGACPAAAPQYPLWMAIERGADSGFDMIAARLRAEGADLQGAVGALAAKLADALPAATRVERGGGRLRRGSGPVRAVYVELGSSFFSCELRAGTLECRREERVGGVTIKRQLLGAEEWLLKLTESLRSAAQQSAQARAMLERLLL